MQLSHPSYKCNCILNPDQLFQGSQALYLGNKGSLSKDIISENQIQSILSVMDGYMYEKLEIDQKVKGLELQNGAYLWLDLEDQEETDIMQYFNQAHEFIDSNIGEKNVLVHCQAGVSRSATIVISYVMRKKNMTAAQATKYVVQRRYQVAPNQGFRQALKRFQKVIYEIPDPKTQFSLEKYATKFCQHIISTKQPSLIENHNLFLGQITAVKAQYLTNLRIKTVISLLSEQQMKRYKIKQLCDHLGIINYYFDIKDEPSQNILALFKQTHMLIEQNIYKGNVLVHCVQGKSRSATIVAAYLMKKFRTSSGKAVEFIQKKRQRADPNKGFRQQLQKYQNAI